MLHLTLKIRVFVFSTSSSCPLTPIDFSNRWLEFFAAVVFQAKLSHISEILDWKATDVRRLLLEVSRLPPEVAYFLEVPDDPGTVGAITEADQEVLVACVV